MQNLKVKIYHPLARRIIEPEEIVELGFILGELNTASILLEDATLYTEHFPKILHFTGKQDSKGKDIYEGDVIEGYDYKNRRSVKGFVEYFDKDTAFIVKLQDGDYCHLFTVSDIKITGNVFTMSLRSNTLKASK